MWLLFYYWAGKKTILLFCGNEKTILLQTCIEKTILLLWLFGRLTYDETLVTRLIEKITVYDDRLVVRFKSGIEMGVDM